MATKTSQSNHVRPEPSFCVPRPPRLREHTLPLRQVWNLPQFWCLASSLGMWYYKANGNNSFSTTNNSLFLRPRPYYAGDIWKRRLIPTVRPSVQTNPSSKRNLSKTVFKPEGFEHTVFSFSCGRKTFWTPTGLLENDDVTIITWFPCPSFPQT